MKKFKAVLNDSGLSPNWEVVGKGGRLVAMFFGKHARPYARAHAKMLNALPEEEKP